MPIVTAMVQARLLRRVPLSLMVDNIATSYPQLLH